MCVYFKPTEIIDNVLEPNDSSLTYLHHFLRAKFEFMHALRELLSRLPGLRVGANFSCVRHEEVVAPLYKETWSGRRAVQYQMSQEMSKVYTFV